MLKKIISFSLWGDSEIYTLGAIENVILAKELFPTWICRFYIGKGVPDKIIKYLKKQKNTEIIIRNEENNLSNMFWRFEPMFENNVKIMLSRDCDSRLSKKEKILIDCFESSTKNFHIIRDSPGHKKEIMGGLFGVKNKYCSPLKKEFDNFPRINQYSNDQLFLSKIVYPFIKKSLLVHDAGYFPDKFKDEKKHPMPPEYKDFIIGDRYDLAPNAAKIFNLENKLLERKRCF